MDKSSVIIVPIIIIGQFTVDTKNIVYNYSYTQTKQKNVRNKTIIESVYMSSDFISKIT